MNTYELIAKDLEDKMKAGRTTTPGKRYVGCQKKPGGGPRGIYVEAPGQKVWPLHHHERHSPDGFNWGYLGSGPAEAARCILIDAVGQPQADRLYQTFKEKVVSQWPSMGVDSPLARWAFDMPQQGSGPIQMWAIEEADVKEWVKAQAVLEDFRNSTEGPAPSAPTDDLEPWADFLDRVAREGQQGQDPGDEQQDSMEAKGDLG
jgi:hypothetical protein